MNEPDRAIEELLKRSAGGAVDCRLKRDLWPEMRPRLDQPPFRFPWWDWALAAALLLCLLVSPETIPGLLCQL